MELELSLIVIEVVEVVADGNKIKQHRQQLLYTQRLFSSLRVDSQSIVTHRHRLDDSHRILFLQTSVDQLVSFFGIPTPCRH